MARRLDPLTRDQILAGQAAGTPIPDGSGRIMRGGVIRSAADTMRAEADRVRLQALEMQTAAYRAPMEAAQREVERARQSGAMPAAAARPALDPETAALGQQLLARSREGAAAGRVYTPESIGRATPAQIRGEFAALPALTADATRRAQADATAGVVGAILGDPGIDPGAPAPLTGRAAAVMSAPGMSGGGLPPVIGPGAAPLDPSARSSTGIAMAAGPNISTDTGLPQGAIGYQRRDGSYTVDMPTAPGQSFANERAARLAFAGMDTGPGPLANRPAAAPLPPANPNVGSTVSGAQPGNMQAGAPITAPTEGDAVRRALAAARASGQPLDFETLDRIARLAERANPRAPGQPSPGSLTLPSGRVIEGITDPTGNFRVIEPDRPARENLSDVGRLIAERDAAVAADRFDVAQIYDERIRRMTSDGQAGGAPTTITVAGVPITIGGAGTPAPVTTPPAPRAATPAPAAAPAQNFTPGQRVRQGNTVYQFDGTNWNPVTQ